jgi:hypothetical protein
MFVTPETFQLLRRLIVVMAVQSLNILSKDVIDVSIGVSVAPVNLKF